MTKTNTIFIALMLNCFCSTLFSQEAPKKVVETKFFRPSMTTTFVNSKSSQVNSIYTSFATVPMEGRFDNRPAEKSSINIDMPPIPAMAPTENPLELKKALSDYRKVVDEWKKQKDNQIKEKLSDVSRGVVANMFGRDAQGNLSYDKIMEAAQYSATDNQSLSASASTNSSGIYTEIAEELLKRGFIVLYDVNSMETFKQYYDKMDAKAQATAAKTGKPATPVKRTSEGWKIGYDYSVYRLVWNDSISTIFYTQVWLDKNNTNAADRAQKKAAFDSFVFPLELVMSESDFASASQPADPAYYEKLRVKRKSMDELLLELAKPMQDEMVFTGGRKIEDFKMRAPIFQESPILVKLGTKEGLYYDERFFVYEIQADEQGNQTKKRQGVVRVSNIAENSIIAKGESPASKFRQQGGKKLYQGTLVELKEDFGLGVNLGYGVDDFAGGIQIGVEARIPSLLKEKKSWGKYLRGLYLNAGLNFKSLSEEQIFTNEFDSTKYSGSALSLGASISRETYLFGKGNIYLMPEIGAGLLSVTINDILSDPADVSGKPTKPLNGSSIYVNGGLGLGWHITPSVSLFSKAGFNMRLGEADWTDEDDKPYPIVNENFNPKSKFSNLSEMSFPISLGVRFRF